MPWADLGYVSVAVDFFVLLAMLVIIISLEGQFGATNGALETSTMEEGEVLQGPNAVHLVNGFAAP